MLNQIIDFSIRNKLIIIIFTLSVAAFGIFSVTEIPVGAVPDVTNNQVQVITVSPNLPTQDIEQFITYPIELEMANLPGVEEIRSISKFGLSVVTIVFKDRMGSYLPRQLIAEKIKTASSRIPEGFGVPEMGPITTGLGEIYQYTLEVKPGYENIYTPMDLRTIQDWVVKRKLSGIPGVVEVNTWGGYLKQYEISVDPVKLQAYQISIVELFNALKANNSVAGGAYIEKNSQSYFIRGDGLLRSLEDIEKVVIRHQGNVPVTIGDVAEVRFGHANRFGAITGNGQGEKILGQIMMLRGANSKEVIRAVKQRVAEVQKSLPEGIYINPVVERSELISRTTFTVYENLILGCLFVMAAVILLLGDLRPALIISSVIPLSLLFTISVMYLVGADVNLMSLGALDFGIIIDGAVIVVEYIAVKVHLSRDDLQSASNAEKQSLMDRLCFDGASKMINSAIFGQVIILIVLIPVFALSGVEGKMFRPMALSFSLAILGAMLFGLTWVPVASSLFLKPGNEQKIRLTRWIMNLLYRSYLPVIRWAYDHKGWVFGMSAVVFFLSIIIFGRLGGEFIPKLDEGDFVIQPVLKTGTSLSKTVEMTTQMEKILMEKFPEIEQIVCRIGAAEIPTDPMSLEEIDMIIKLKPRKEWITASTKEQLAEAFKEALSVIPDVEYEFTQPIEMRFNELITGVRADIAIKIFGEDLNYMTDIAAQIKPLVEKIPGAADVILEKTEGLPQMSVRYRRDKLAYYGLSVMEVNELISMAFGGAKAGDIFEGEKQFDLVVRYLPAYRRDIENLQNMPVPLPGGGFIPLREVATVEYTTGPAKISRDNTYRRVVVSVNVRNRDMQSVVKDIQKVIEENIQLRSGYTISYGGQFENLIKAKKRLQLVIPVSLLLIFIFLHFAFRSLKYALMIFSAIPLAVVGGVFLLWLRGMPFSVSAGIGFIALFGVAVLNGIVLIEHLRELSHGVSGDLRDLIIKGAQERLRPVALTASAAALGFLPMAVSTSAGAEVQRPLATVVIGGLFTSTLLTMIVLPLLFATIGSIKGFDIRRMKFIRSATLLILIGMMFIPGRLSAQQPVILTIDQAISMALENNPKIEIASKKVSQATAEIPTYLDIDKTYLYYHFDQNNIAENNYPIGVIGIEQNLAFPSYYQARKKSALQFVTLAETELEIEKLNLQREIYLEYLHASHIYSKLNEYRMADSIFREYLKSAEKMMEKGLLSRLDVINAEVQQRKIELVTSALRIDLENSNKRLMQLIRPEFPVEIQLTSLQPLDFQPEELHNHPLLRLYQQHIHLQEISISIEKSRLWPDINFGFFDGTNRYPDARHYMGYQVGLQVPLFFGAQRSRIKSEKIALEMAQIRYEYLKDQLETRFATLYNEYLKYRKVLEDFQASNLELYRELLNAAHLSFQLGQIGYFQYAQSIANALEIKIQYLDILADYNRTVTELKYLVLQ